MGLDKKPASVVKSFWHDFIMKFDTVLEAVGNCSRYQAYLYLIFAWAHFALKSNLTFMALGNLPPKAFACSGPSNNYTLNWVALEDACNYNSINSCPRPMRKFQDDPRANFYSVATHFGLVCEKKYALSRIYSQQMIGQLIGTLFLGWLADKTGRKLVWVISAAFQMIIGGWLIVDYSDTWEAYGYWRLLLGICMGGHVVSAWTLLIESIGSKYRFALKPIGYYIFALFWFAYLAYHFPDWRTLSFVSNFQSFPALFLVCYLISESPRWLIIHNKLNKAKSAFKNIADINGRPFPALECEKLMKLQTDFRDSQSTVELSLLRVLFHNRYTIPLLFNWFTVSAVSYGMVFHLSQMSGSPYFLLTIQGILPWTFNLIALFLDQRYTHVGRKFIHTYSMTIPCICFLYVAFSVWLNGVASDAILGVQLTACLLFAQGVIEGAWTTCYNLPGELYPTRFRNTATGICNSAGRLGAAFSPYLFSIGAQIWPPLPYLILAFMTMTGAILVLLFIHETKNRALPEDN